MRPISLVGSPDDAASGTARWCWLPFDRFVEEPSGRGVVEV
jgi:hypothetical protein